MALQTHTQTVSMRWLLTLVVLLAATACSEVDFSEAALGTQVCQELVAQAVLGASGVQTRSPELIGDEQQDQDAHPNHHPTGDTGDASDGHGRKP